MNAHSVIRYLFKIILLLVFLHAHSHASPLSYTDSYADLAASFAEIAAQDGFLVLDGMLYNASTQDCEFLIQTTGSCFGNNPQTPYGYFMFPKISSELELPPILFFDMGMYTLWQLSGSEALIYIGHTPPETSYFGYTPYVVSRFQEMSSAGAPIYRTIFASTNDTINNTNIRTLNDLIYDDLTVIVITADQHTEEYIVSVLTGIGYPEEKINFHRIPSLFGDSLDCITHLGHGLSKDVFTYIVRTNMFSSEEEKDAYLTSPKISLLRIIPSPENPADEPVIPYVAEQLQSREGFSESELKKPYNILRNHFENKMRKYILRDYKAIRFSMVEGYSCLKYGYPCAGDNRDTTYIGTSVGRYRDDVSYYVIGINHTAFGNAVYSNVTLYNVNNFVGISSSSNQDYAGSASSWIDDMADTNPSKKLLQNNQQYFYIVKFSRSCNGEEYCYEIPAGDVGLNPGNIAGFMARAYVVPGSSVSMSYRDALPFTVYAVR